MNIEKIKQIAKDKYGKELSDEQATAYAKRQGRLSDNELDNISGGCDDFDSGKTCDQCGGTMVNRVTGGKGYWICYSCNHQIEC